MKIVSNNKKQNEQSLIWIIKILSGIMIILFLGIHLIVNHLVVPEGLLSYAEIIRYFSNPLIFVMEITFLIIVVTHSLIGLRSIILDLNFSQKYQSLIDRILVLAGIISVAYGAWLALILFTRGSTL